MKQLCTLFAVIAVLALTSCSKTGNGTVEYIPFQETADGQWGMISMDGKVLFKEEFKSKPTVVRDGRFFVRNKDGFWEMYDATEKPKKIGADYTHTSGFRNGVALVAEKGKPVSIIDTDGKTVKTLDKLEGKEVDGVKAFNGDYAVFMTTDSLWGAVDKSGKCVVKPEYYSLNDCGDGKFIGVNAKYAKDVKKDKKKNVKISVIGVDGKVMSEFSAEKYENIKSQFIDGLLPVSVKKDAKETWGIINDKGEVVVKPSDKIKDIGSIHEDMFTYNNGEGWGLMNTKGETLIRAKYEFLYYDQDGILVALVKNGDSYEFKYVDEKDNQIGDETYVRATLHSMFDGEHALVKPNDKIYSIIDKECNQLEGLPDIVDVGTYEGETYIESDYVDLNKVIAAFDITADGVMGVTFKSEPKSVVKKSIDLNLAPGDDKHPEGTPYWYDYSDKIDLYKNVNGVNGVVNVKFTDNLSRQTFRTKRVIDYTYGDWYWYHDEKVPTGYVWNKVTPKTFAFIVYNYGRMYGKMRSFYKLLSNKFKKMGTVVKENNSAIVVNLVNNNRAMVVMDKNSVWAYWGKLKAANDIDIDIYKDAVEEDSEANVSYGYLNDLFPDEQTDTLAVDTVETIY